MTEGGKDRPFEEKLASVTQWIDTIADEGRVDPISPEVLREVLTKFRADFEPRPELDSLSGYTSIAKKPGLDAVWGKEKVDRYKDWIKRYVSEYEIDTGKELPVLYDPKTKKATTIKTSGMMQFFGELTALAAEKMSFKKYKRLTEDRARKGRLWRARKPGEPIVTTEHASFPPPFPSDAWRYIKDWLEMEL